MIQIYDTISRITDPETAKEIIIFLIDNFNFYISFEEMQQLNIK